SAAASSRSRSESSRGHEEMQNATTKSRSHEERTKKTKALSLDTATSGYNATNRHENNSVLLRGDFVSSRLRGCVFQMWKRVAPPTVRDLIGQSFESEFTSKIRMLQSHFVRTFTLAVCLTLVVTAAPSAQSGASASSFDVPV